MKIALIIISDRAFNGIRSDLTGPILIDYLKQRTPDVEYALVPDEKELIKQEIKKFIDANYELILTSGGTGFAKRDVTPEATKEIIEKDAPGIAEYIRFENAKNSSNSYLSRLCCGISNNSIILNLPGSPNGALECYKIAEKLLEHAIRLLKGEIRDCKNDK